MWWFWVFLLIMTQKVLFTPSTSFLLNMCVFLSLQWSRRTAWCGHPSHLGSSAPVRSSEKRKYGTVHFTSNARRASKLCEHCGEKNGMIPRPEWMWNKGYLGGLLRGRVFGYSASFDICLPVGFECDNAITQCLTEVCIRAIVCYNNAGISGSVWYCGFQCNSCCTSSKLISRINREGCDSCRQVFDGVVLGWCSFKTLFMVTFNPVFL